MPDNPEKSTPSPSMPLSTPEPMLLKMPTVRKRFIVKGDVQIVGYRVLVKLVANHLGIMGSARNLPDRSVEIVCEGDPEIIERFLKKIDRKGDPAATLDINVASIEEAPPPPAGELTSFEIDYGRKLSIMEKETTDREERMILGASDLTMMMGGVGKAVEVVGQKVDGLGVKMDCVGQNVVGVGKAVEGVGKDVRNMHGDMNKRFDHMADRYDMIALSLKEAIVHMDRNAEKTDKAIEKSRKETILAVRESQKETAKILATSRKEIAVESNRTRKEIAESHRETTKELTRSRKEFTASNRELAAAVKFMIKKMSDKPVKRKPSKKRK